MFSTLNQSLLFFHFLFIPFKIFINFFNFLFSSFRPFILIRNHLIKVSDPKLHLQFFILVFHSCQSTLHYLIHHFSHLISRNLLNAFLQDLPLELFIINPVEKTSLISSKIPKCTLFNSLSDVSNHFLTAASVGILLKNFFKL